MTPTALAGRPATPASGERLLSLEEALERLLAGVETLPAEMAPLQEAAGRILAADVYADTALPPWDNSAMDGFAVIAADVASAAPDHPVRLAVSGEVAAGHAPTGIIQPGSALRIMTGAALPPAADAVVPVEDTSAWRGPRRGAGAPLPEAIDVFRSVTAGDHLRRVGEDVTVGSKILRVGERMSTGAVALAAAVGRDRVSVVRRPHVALLATGDEIVAPGQPAGIGQIHDANTAGLSVLARRSGAVARSFGIAPDDLPEVMARLNEALGWADVIVVSGGVSVGARDIVKDAFDALGSVDFWRVAVQPGKPLAFGRAERARGAPPGGPVLLFGLPGNPVSSFVTFELFVRAAVRRLSGLAPLARRTGRAVLAEGATKSSERRAFLRVRLEPGKEPDALPLARLSGGQGSHVISALAAAEALAVVPEGISVAEAGTEVEVWPLEEDA
jgi:molybdopterin molybdotransferase